VPQPGTAVSFFSRRSKRKRRIRINLYR
jgi:hypothetical protein